MSNEEPKRKLARGVIPTLRVTRSLTRLFALVAALALAVWVVFHFLPINNLMAWVVLLVLLLVVLSWFRR